LEKILKYLQNIKVFRWILLDCCHQMDEVTLKALELSDEIFLVTNPSIPALSNAKKLLELFNLLGLDSSKAQVILNAWQKRGDLSESEVVNFLGREINKKITFDSTQVVRSINEGRPLWEIAPRHAVSQELKAIAAGLMGDEEPRSGSWIKRLIGKD
jgi:pilus assembly protein CpaE